MGKYLEREEQKIDFKQFLADYFDSDEEGSQFDNFAREVIIPFKNAIAYLFDIEGTNKFKPEPKKEAVKVEAKAKPAGKTSEYFEEVNGICKDICQDMEYIKIKDEQAEDIKYLTETIKFATEKNDTKMVNALVIGLCYVLKQVRKLRFYERELRGAMESLYLN